jgi:nucleotide-binding universal stress UspA family protein
MKVALAIDGSDCSLRATRFLIGLIGGRDGSEVHILNVQPPVRYAYLLPAKRKRLVKQWYRDGGDTETAAALEMLAEANVSREFHLVIGDPATAIVELARRVNCDLIVMGTRAMGKVAGLVHGSVATKVMHLVDAPVTLVK